jgi:Kef-type K+ transport system membrane component KefB
MVGPPSGIAWQGPDRFGRRVRGRRHSDARAPGEFRRFHIVRTQRPRTIVRQESWVSAFLVPILFVLMGMRTDLRSFAQPGVAGLAAALTVAAIVGKQACSLGVLGRGVDRLTVGLGMIPRGEVGLIFANIGLALTLGGAPLIDKSTFSAVVVTVIVTTTVTPPALKWSLGRLSKRNGNS